MKRILYLIIIINSFNFLEVAQADDSTKPMLVIDAKNTTSLPRSFRLCTSSYLDNLVRQLTEECIAIPTREGLSDLHVAACGQFSKKQLVEVKKRIPGELWIVDFREESHGFLNGDAISWYGTHNDTNKNFTLKEILAREHTLLDKLKALNTAVVFKIQEKFAYTISQAHANPTPVGSIMSEAKLARIENIHYIRFPVTDHHAPSPEIAQKFINFYKSLPPNAYLLIHCRGGRARSTFFMALCDIIKNGQDLSLKEILYRQYLLGGKNLLNDVDSDDETLGKIFQERFITIKTLYEQITGKPADIS